MRSFLIATLLTCLSPLILNAQCDTSSRNGIHVVQAGENLYRIALKHGVKMSQICAWNDIKIDQVLPACKELKVKPPTYARLTSTESEFKERGTIEATAPPAQPIATGPTNKTLTSDTSTEMPQEDNTQDAVLPAKRQTGKRHTVEYGETIESIAEAYGYTPNRLREINVMRADEILTEGSIILTSDCSCDLLPRTEIHIAAENQKNRNGSTFTMDHRGGGTTSYGHTSSKPSPSSSISFMQSDEIDMVNEINLLRSNPGGYAQYVRTYLENSKNGKGFPTDEASVNELIAELNRTAPLSKLKVTECIYNAARKHGVDELSRGSTGHVGTDGSYPWDRVIKECPQFREGGENLVGGHDNVRDAVIALLIDQGIPNRGHRRTLLNKDWKYIACYKVGKVGSMPHCWVQNFGY